MLKSSLVVRYGSVLLALAACGCGRATGPKTAPVSGKVMAGGEPFKQGRVRFIPDAGQNINMREAVTDDDGSYKIMFSPQQPGLEPGKYTVMFSKWQMPDGSPPPDQGETAYPKEPRELGAVEWVAKDFATGTNEKCKVTIDDKGGTFDFDIGELKASAKK